ncbi:MAG: hypothetical protein JNK05_36625 [Myxococcales bacterium]|nr:hypothetical protein [Myxococcales bacterium]
MVWIELTNGAPSDDDGPCARCREVIEGGAIVAQSIALHPRCYADLAYRSIAGQPLDEDDPLAPFVAQSEARAALYTQPVTRRPREHEASLALFDPRGRRTTRSLMIGPASRFDPALRDLLQCSPLLLWPATKLELVFEPTFSARSCSYDPLVRRGPPTWWTSATSEASTEHARWLAAAHAIGTGAPVVVLVRDDPQPDDLDDIIEARRRTLCTHGFDGDAATVLVTGSIDASLLDRLATALEERCDREPPQTPRATAILAALARCTGDEEGVEQLLLESLVEASLDVDRATLREALVTYTARPDLVCSAVTALLAHDADASIPADTRDGLIERVLDYERQPSARLVDGAVVALRAVEREALCAAADRYIRRSTTSERARRLWLFLLAMDSPERVRGLLAWARDALPEDSLFRLEVERLAAQTTV